MTAGARKFWEFCRQLQSHRSGGESNGATFGHLRDHLICHLIYAQMFASADCYFGYLSALVPERLAALLPRCLADLLPCCLTVYTPEHWASMVGLSI